MGEADHLLTPPIFNGGNMAKLKLRDILALTRAGYKAAEIRQMTEDDDIPEQDPEPVPEQSPAEPEPDADVPEDPGTEEQDNPDPGPDYKALFEEAQKKLRAAQEVNRRQPGPEEPKVSNEEYIKNLVENFY